MENKHFPSLNINSARRGFTLLETLVAISILLIAVVNPISLIGDSLHNLYFAKDEMLALNLAQEGIEVIRQQRDSDMLSSAPASLYSFPANTTNYYVVDASNGMEYSVAGAQPLPIYFNNGFYKQSTTPLSGITQFSRVVSVSNADLSGSESREVKVISTVTWRTGNDSGVVTVSENLFNWAI